MLTPHGTCVEQLIVITHLYEGVFDLKWPFQRGGELNNLLESLDIEIEIRQLYRRLSIPAVIEEMEEENE